MLFNVYTNLKHNIRYEEDNVAEVQVYFISYDEGRTLNMNGYIPLTAEEFEGNESTAALKGVIRNKLIERLEPEAVQGFFILAVAGRFIGGIITAVCTGVIGGTIVIFYNVLGGV